MTTKHIFLNCVGMRKVKSEHCELRASHRGKGFTLIELMVVIAIILMLVGIMIPALTRQLERGREARAKADVKILTSAIDLFRVDQGRYPIQGNNPLNELLNPPDGREPYIADESIPQTPWKGNYLYSLGGNHYTIQATDSQGIVKYEKRVNF